MINTMERRPLLWNEDMILHQSMASLPFAEGEIQCVDVVGLILTNNNFQPEPQRYAD